MHEPLVVHALQSPQNRRKHGSRFLRRQRTLRKNLREILLGVLHHNVEQLRAFQFAASSRKYANQIRMGQFAGRLPLEELIPRTRPVGGNQLDGGLPGIVRTSLRKKHSTVIGTTYVALERKSPIDRAPLPSLPVLEHLPS